MYTKLMNRIVPIIVGTAAVLILLGATFLIARPTYAAPFVYGVGGTGTTTPNPGQVVWWGSANQKGIATTSVTCSGSTSCTSFTAIGSSPITITSSGGAGAAYPFTPGTFGSTNTSATSTAINDTVGFISTGTSTLFNLTSINSTSTNATSSEFAVTGSAKNCNGTSALTTSAAGNLTCTAQPQGTVTAVSVATANGFAGSSSGGATPALTLTTTVTGLTLGNGTALSAYGGGSCTYFITSLNGSGVPTCAGFSYPFVYATTFNTLSAGTSTPLWLQGSPYSLFASSTSIIDYATSTAVTVNNALYIPNSANPAPGVTNGRVWIDTTDASSSIHYVQNGNEYALFASTTVAFNYSTTTPAGTTTIMVAGATRKVIYDQIGCSSVGGTVTVAMGNGTATSTYVISGTSLATAYSVMKSNNTFTQGVVRFFALGNWSSTGISQVSCSLSQAYDPS